MSIKTVLILCALVLLLGIGLYLNPETNSRISWRWDRATTYILGIIKPAGPVPTSNPSTTGQSTPTVALVPTGTGLPSVTPTSTPAPPPRQVFNPAPPYELQDRNNCGPATLSMALHVYNWEGDQFDISSVIKPKRGDRNVNPEEMVFWVRNYAGWLRAEFRVNGNIPLLKRLIAAGYPVIVEETFKFDEPYWLNDDLWAAHYLLLTGYDDETNTFIGHDSFYGADQLVSYDELEESWKPFNYVYMLIYLPEEEDEISSILGSDWDPDINRQNALAASQARSAENPEDAFAWFNYGANLVYFENYAEAASAFDSARNLGLPQRMMRYQFTPFLAYFHANRLDDLFTLTNYALDRTRNSEEAYLWHGWGLYRQGDYAGARSDWEKALFHRPDYTDALYALDFVR